MNEVKPTLVELIHRHSFDDVGQSLNILKMDIKKFNKTAKNLVPEKEKVDALKLLVSSEDFKAFVSVVRDKIDPLAKGRIEPQVFYGGVLDREANPDFYNNIPYNFLLRFRSFIIGFLDEDLCRDLYLALVQLGLDEPFSLEERARSLAQSELENDFLFLKEIAKHLEQMKLRSAFYEHIQFDLSQKQTVEEILQYKELMRKQMTDSKESLEHLLSKLQEDIKSA